MAEMLERDKHDKHDINVCGGTGTLKQMKCGELVPAVHWNLVKPSDAAAALFLFDNLSPLTLQNTRRYSTTLDLQPKTTFLDQPYKHSHTRYTPCRQHLRP